MTIADTPLVQPGSAPVTRHFARLAGPYLKHTNCIVLMRGEKIVDCESIRSVWSGTERFDAWFCEQYGPIVLMIPIRSAA